MKYQKLITIDPKIMAGKPVITGIRIPVDLILKKVAQNMMLRKFFVIIQAALWYSWDRRGLFL